MVTTTFDTEFRTDAWPDMASKFGRTVTYTPRGGSPTDITVIWDATTVGTMEYPDGQQSIQTAELVEGGGAIVNPHPEDIATVDGVVWAVTDDGVQQTGPMVVLRLERRTQERLGGGRMER